MSLAEQINNMREERANRQQYVCALVAYGGITLSKPMSHEEAIQQQHLMAGIEGFCIVMPAGWSDEAYQKLFSSDYKFVSYKED